jgi:hypothetical protein
LNYKGIQPGMAAQPMRTRGKTQNKPSKKRAVTQLENANLKDTRRSRQKHIKV